MIEGAVDSLVPNEEVLGSFDHNQYKKVISAFSFGGDGQVVTDGSVRQSLDQIRGGRIILGESLRESELVDSTLNSLLELESMRFGLGIKSSLGSEANALGCDLVYENLQQIESSLDLAKPERYQLAMETVTKLLNMGRTTSQRESAIDFLIRYFQDGLRTADAQDVQEPVYTSYPSIADSILSNGRRDQVEAAIGMLEQAVLEPETHQRALDVVSRNVGRYVDEEIKRELKERIIRRELENLDLDYDDLAFAWAGETGKLLDYCDERNLPLLFSLESSHKGICRTLIDEFGIKNFGRFTKEMLVDLFEQRNNRELPYGVLLASQSDHSGDIYATIGQLDNSYKQLKALGFGLRIYECASKIDIARAFLKSAKRYGKDNKICFVMVDGHGTPEKIVLGWPKDGGQVLIDKTTALNEINKADLEGTGTQRISEFLTDDAPIILNACLTGVDDGLAQTMSSKYQNRKFHATAGSTTIDVVEIEKDEEDKLLFKIRYMQDGIARTYLNGEQIN
ncbi:hypothetical protein HY407_01105 [Candidatus Gottesmanbacteria bacterium]|nr:hypothetical protein [Candidatus Gottesmanbacteria bacterium]